MIALSLCIVTGDLLRSVVILVAYFFVSLSPVLVPSDEYTPQAEEPHDA